MCISTHVCILHCHFTLHTLMLTILLTLKHEHQGEYSSKHGGRSMHDTQRLRPSFIRAGKKGKKKKSSYVPPFQLIFRKVLWCFLLVVGCAGLVGLAGRDIRNARRRFFPPHHSSFYESRRKVPPFPSPWSFILMPFFLCCSLSKRISVEIARTPTGSLKKYFYLLRLGKILRITL